MQSRIALSVLSALFMLAPHSIYAQSNDKNSTTSPSAAQDQTKKEPKPEKKTQHDDMPEMDMNMPGMDMNMNMPGMDMTKHTVSLQRGMPSEGSGTGLEPESTPMFMTHRMYGDWMVMFHYNVIVGVDQQVGPRAPQNYSLTDKTQSTNWGMVMAQRQVGHGVLMLRSMVSAEPFTEHSKGMPEQFQTGEALGSGQSLAPNVDTQHKHNLLMELGAQYTVPFTPNYSCFVYAAPVGEPALGPTAAPHRLSAAEEPAMALGHHHEDSTHISDEVVTLGCDGWRFIRLEGSVFHGAEPGSNRYAIGFGAPDSWSARITLTPLRFLSMQFSHGFLHSPEQLEPGVNQSRTTASVSVNKPWHNGYVANTLAWGRTCELGKCSNAYLFESSLNFKDRNHVFTRLELLDQPELAGTNSFDDPGLAGLTESQALARSFRVAAQTFGYVYDIKISPMRMGLGAAVQLFDPSRQLTPIYGSNPKGFYLFLQLRPGKH